MTRASREKGIDVLRFALVEALEHKGREPVIVVPELTLALLRGVRTGLAAEGSVAASERR